MVGKKRGRFVAFAAGALAVWLTVSPVLAQSPEDDEIRGILEKSLSVVELDKEINRIEQQQQTITRQLKESRENLERQRAAIDKHREDAGKVLRAYYTGERDVLLAAILSSDSFADFLAMMDYFDVIFSNDQLTLDRYSKQYNELKKGVARLGKESEQLDQVGEQLKAQRERVTVLQHDVDSSLSGRSDADKLRLMISELTSFWQNVGVYEVKRYFGALADAMKNLPEWVQKNKDMLEIDGFNYTLTIPENKLNAFLRGQNPLFDNFAFVFEHGVLSVTGKRDGLDVKISGHYTVEEIDTGNAIIFHVDELIFNGLALPDTTRKSLEDQFDLGFYPQKIVSFLQAKSVAVEDGKLIVKLSVNL
ncbi:hypothetical protein KZ483_19885 [Paenibacillus sp. sptzw28]|uniref:coiled-coil domain-containing protein n=1 Tax=Paenibacillus sp. sptzw28 TaxID=715179 RepID=UPI001C6E861A|nr:hypothetical protein [Paenibacillus sp. sptzw28]QYR20103.1 hypothetical protein KZ483_19885 [Paenibacillus sp. sptzw28]